MTTDRSLGGGVLPVTELKQQFGSIDIYLFDQLLRGRVAPGTAVLDAGCGQGRNLHYLIRAGFDVHALDRKAERLASLQDWAREHAPSWCTQRAVQGQLSALPYADSSFGAVLASAVLHFARDPGQFTTQLNELWRVLAPGGVLWTRLASSIGLEQQLTALGEQRFLLPDGSQRFLVSEQDLLKHTADLGGVLADPIKTTNVQGLRCMTTWVLNKPARPST